MWKSSEIANNNIRFAVGGMIINRIASAINTMLIIKSNNKKAAAENRLSFNAGIASIAPTMPEFLQFSVRAGL
jgi:predicted glycosyltransferase